MNKSSSLFALFMIASIPSHAADEPLWEAGLGIATVYLPDYRGSNHSRGYALPMPYFIYRGDFFKEPLPEADVLVMGRILHDWDLDEKRMLLDKAYKALPDGGALIVYESIIDDDRRENAFGLLMSLNMLIETPGGFDYTGADCRGWMEEAGFRDTYVEQLLGPDSMVVGFK